MNTLVLILVVLAIAAGGVVAWKAEQKRRQAFALWALEHGWDYDHRTHETLRNRYDFLDRLQLGHSRQASHYLHGAWEGYPATAFCFNYTTGSGNHQQTHTLGVALLEIEQVFPELRVYPENMLSSFGQFLGYEDIDFESVEFSKAFTVRSGDKKLAYDFCNTDMMTLLLQNRSTALELEGRTLAIYLNRFLKPQDLGPMFEHLCDIRKRMPDYLFQS